MWAGPPGTQNSIITVEDERRQSYLVKSQWNAVRQEILFQVNATL